MQTSALRSKLTYLICLDELLKSDKRRIDLVEKADRRQEKGHRYRENGCVLLGKLPDARG